MAHGLTYGQLAARLIVEASLDKIAGKETGKFPIDGISLNETQRANLGRPPGGTTMYYQVAGKNGVFMDLQGSTTTVWFREADGSDALNAFEAALKQSYPNAKQREDKAHATNESVRQRSYDVPLSGGRAAVVDIVYAAPGRVARSFVARILAYAARNEQRH